MLDHVAFEDLVRDDVMAQIDGTTASRLPFGAIELSPAGVVLSYNLAESRNSGHAAENVVGRHFFKEVAPCTQRPEFRDLFFAGVRADSLDEHFRYTFAFPERVMTVEVRMKRSVVSESCWIFVKALPTDA